MGTAEYREGPNTIGPSGSVKKRVIPSVFLDIAKCICVVDGRSSKLGSGRDGGRSLNEQQATTAGRGQRSTTEQTGLENQLRTVEEYMPRQPKQDVDVDCGSRPLKSVVDKEEALRDRPKLGGGVAGGGGLIAKIKF
jgi:hypothetical protein